jgi:hypothetical protein
MAKAASLLRFEITQSIHATFHRNLLDEGSTPCRDLCLKKHNVYNIKPSVLQAGLEPAIPSSELPQTHSLESITWIFTYNSNLCKSV